MLLPRRSAALAAGALLTAGLLAGCGFDVATNQVNQLTPGTTDRDQVVDVVNTIVVAEADDSGTLVGQLVNNDNDDTIRLISITGDGVTATGLDRLPVPGDGAAQLADAGIRVDGDFTAGGYVTLTLGFDNDEEVELDVPVMAACHEFEGLDDAPRENGSTEAAEPYDCEAPEPPEVEH